MMDDERESEMFVRASEWEKKRKRKRKRKEHLGGTNLIDLGNVLMGSSTARHQHTSCP
jgi:hypothetical protein